MKTQKDFSFLPQAIFEKLTAMGITVPTPVQAQSMGPILDGKDLIATAQTGTGKTLAFVLPLVMKMQEDKQAEALILSPTRELAQQTYQTLSNLWKDAGKLPAALIIGGDNIHKQFAELRKKPRFIIATPGRVIDHMQRKTISLNKIKYVVLDETDRMLDMGFIVPLRQILKAVPQPRQTLMFSATMPKEIVGLTKEFLTNPASVKIGSVTQPIDLITQELVQLATRDKLNQLLEELDTRKGSILIFVKTKHGADRLAKQIKQYGHKVNALHGDLRQNRRRQVLEFFREGSIPLLIATDVAARGIDVPHIGHVINYDLPMCPEDYIHRIGRTGRAGVVGSAISFVADDGQKWKAICKSIGLTGKVASKTKISRPLPEPKFVVEDLRASKSKGGKKEGKKGGKKDGRGQKSFSKPVSKKEEKLAISDNQEVKTTRTVAQKQRPAQAESKQRFSMRGGDNNKNQPKTGKPINTSPKARRENLEKQLLPREAKEFTPYQKRGGKFTANKGAKPFGKKNFGADHSARKESFKKEGGYGDKKFGGKNFGDPKNTFKKEGGYGDKKFGGKNFGDPKNTFKKEGGYGDKKFGAPKNTFKKEGGYGDKKFGDKKFGDKKFGDKKFGAPKNTFKKEGGYGDKKFGDKKFGDKKFGAPKNTFKKEGGYGDKKFGDKKFADKKFGDRKFNDKKSDGKKFGDKKFSNKKPGDKKFGDRKFNDKKSDGKKFGDKKFSNKKPGDKKFGGPKGRFDAKTEVRSSGPKIVRVGASKKKLEKPVRRQDVKKTEKKPSIFSRFFKGKKRK